MVALGVASADCAAAVPDVCCPATTPIPNPAIETQETAAIKIALLVIEDPPARSAEYRAAIPTPRTPKSYHSRIESLRANFQRCARARVGSLSAAQRVC